MLPWCHSFCHQKMILVFSIAAMCEIRGYLSGIYNFGVSEWVSEWVIRALSRSWQFCSLIVTGTRFYQAQWLWSVNKVVFVCGVYVLREQFNWCSGAVCYTRSEKCYPSEKMYLRIAIFNIKICYYDVLFKPILSKLEIFAIQNFESKLFPVCTGPALC